MSHDGETEGRADLFRPFAERNAEKVRPATPAAVARPRPGGGGRPCALMDNGLVRTTGWLQFGDRPVGTGSVAAVIGLLVAAGAAVPMAPVNPVAAAVVLVMLPAVGYGSWSLLGRLRPASTARNVAVVSAGSLCVDSWVRVYGSIGPVAKVASSESDSDSAMAATYPDGVVTVRFQGGTTMTWPRQHPVHLVELTDTATEGLAMTPTSGG